MEEKEGNQLTLARNLIVYEACMLQPITRTRSHIMFRIININASKCDEKSAELAPSVRFFIAIIVRIEILD